ncbi:MAG: response regulator [Opitutae bacterium]|nr:response regulator [Opitutae bacterium]
MRSNLQSDLDANRRWPLPSQVACGAYAQLQHLRILVINDDHGVSQFLQLLLEGDGHLVLTTDRGTTGVELAALRPDLIICDMKMPGLDGFGVLRAVRHNSHTEDIPFIFLTGSVDTDDMRRGVALGADDCVAMPFAKKDLAAAIAASCYKHELLQLRLRISAGLGQPELNAPLLATFAAADRLRPIG